MKVFRYSILLVLIMCLTSGSISYAADKHWVYDELAAFKQSILPMVKTIPANGTATPEEWELIQTTLLSEEKLDEPILVRNWALMLNMVLDLPVEERSQLLEMYAFGLRDDQYILREDAVGGLVKLLTLGYIKGGSNYEELKPSDQVKDMSQVSDKQNTLVRMAYVEGILDSTVKEYFRPKDRLTNAEAISMLHKVITRFDISLKLKAAVRPEHWSAAEIGILAKRVINNDEMKEMLEKVLYNDKNLENPYTLDTPISAENWNNLLMTALKLKDSRYEKDFLENYTYGLAESGLVPRDAAIAGMMKLLHASGRMDSRDAYDEERKAAGESFRDYQTAFDTSKLAIAYGQELVRGYADGTFRPKEHLTNAEAVVLIGRIIYRYGF